MALVNSNPNLGFSYSSNGLYSTASNQPVVDANGLTFYSNSGTKWQNLADSSAIVIGYNTPGTNPAPITCNSVGGCPGIFNINNVKNNPANNSVNDRVNYLPSDASTFNTSQASTTLNFANAKTYRFPYEPVEDTVNNMYCFEPNGPNNKGCADGFICAQMDGIVPAKYQDQYFSDNQKDISTGFQGPATNICYGGNFNLVNTNYEANKKDPIQSNSSQIRTPVYPERGVTLYQNPGCNRENNPDGKNSKYVGGTIKYEGKGVEIFGNCDVCFYANPLIYAMFDSTGTYTGDRYMSMNLVDKYGNPSDTPCLYKLTDSMGFCATTSGSSILEQFGDSMPGIIGNMIAGNPSALQAYTNIPNSTPNAVQCIIVVRNDGIMSAIEYIDPLIQAELDKYPNLSLNAVSDVYANLDVNYGAKLGKLIYEDDNKNTDYNYVRYSGDYGVRILPNEIHDSSSDGLGVNDITKNKLLKGIVVDPTMTLVNSCDLENPCEIYMYKSEICPLPCAPNISNTKYMLTPGIYDPPYSSANFDLTVSSAFDGFSSIYIPPHMEVISTHSYNQFNRIVRIVYKNPIRYEDSPLGDGCFPSFHPADKFGILGNSLIAISVRVRKDPTFINKYVRNTLYNATAKSLEKPAPASIGTVSMFRPDVLLVDPNPDNIPNINKGEYYQHGGEFPIEDAYNGYLTFNAKYREYLSGKKPGWFTKLKNKLKGTNPNIEMLYNAITTFRMNPNINVFSLEWLYVLYYCAMTNMGNGDSSGGCQATYVNEPYGTASGLIGDSYQNRCTVNNMSCLLFNKPLGCNSCNLTGNNMVLANGTTNTCGNSIFAGGQLGPSSADQFMITYCSVMSNKIFPFYFSMYQAGNIDCACLANIGSCPFNNWLPCSQTSDQYKTAGKSGAYIQCASASATSTRNCQVSAINCANYNYQYGEDNYNADQTANLSGTCLTIETGSGQTGTGSGNNDQKPPPPATSTSSSKMWEYLIIIILVVIIVVAFVVFGLYKSGHIFNKK